MSGVIPSEYRCFKSWASSKCDELAESRVRSSNHFFEKMRHSPGIASPKEQMRLVIGRNTSCAINQLHKFIVAELSGGLVHVSKLDAAHPQHD